MANKQVINHTDIAEKGATKPLIEEMIALLNVIKDVDGSIVKLAKDLKIMLSSAKPDSLQGITKLTENTEAANRVYDSRVKLLKEQKRLESDLVEAMEEEIKYNKSLKVEIENINKTLKENAKLNSTTVTSYEKSIIQLNRMAKVLKDLAIQGKSNTAEFKTLKKTYDDLFVSISNAERMVGDHRRNVGNYESGFRNLQHSINQVTRELPAFTNSVQTGFMAISNNIPMLVDQMKLLNEENKRLKANGEQTIPVWRQMVKGIASWQSLLSVGITLLTVYSKEIWEGVRSMFGYEDATKKAEEAQKAFNDSLEEGRRRSAAFRDEITNDIDFTTKSLVAAAKKRGASEQEIRDIEEKGRQKSIEQQQRYVDNLIGLTQKASRKLSELRLQETAFISEHAHDLINKDLPEELRKAIEEAEKAYNQQVRDREAAEAELTRMKRDAIITRKNLEAQDAENARQAAAKAAEQARKEEERKKREWEKNQEEIRKFNLRKMKEGIVTYIDELGKVIVESIKKDNDAGKRLAKEAQAEIINTQRVTYEQYRAAADEGYKKTREKNAKQQEKEAQERSRFLQQQVDTLQRFTQRETDINNQKISDELGANQRRQDQLRELAAKGSLDAQNSLALEERKRAELEAQRIKNLKNQKRQELIFAGIKAYAANVEKNPDGAFAKTSKDIIKLTSLLTNLPSFKKGTENTGNVGHGVDGEGGFHAILHPNERVLTKEQNMKIGDFTNEELANLAFMARVGTDNTDLVDETRTVGNKVDKLIKVIEQKPTQTFEVDEVKKLIHITTETMHSRKTNTRRIGRYGF